ncbi:hypothetical protein NHX12_003346 [Muraenolepis orangiensis]|uniref:HSF-type DNA-binding domain-containing protein n=1 Tax=Muraenolepis orangiensis TaxID=630683 RepID=A0A9Q0DYL4_9TELE|nr:hypothetical protein NHX12_003346 [Muraenolepis orangiensis]
MQESPGAGGVDGIYTSNVPAFLTKLWTLVEDPDTNQLICWSATGTSFHVFDQGRFAKEVLPKYFKHNNMASFVRQLNMCHEHLLEHIKRKVSIVKSEETKVRQEDLSKLLYEVQLLRTQQDNMECQMQDMKQQNELIQFLFSQMQPNSPSSVGLKRKLPLMLDEGSPSPPPASKFSHSLPMEALQEPFYIQSPSNESASCSMAGITGGPIISDVTDMSQSTSMALQLQTNETRDKAEVSDTVENVDMNLEDLQQLLLRSHQQGTVDYMFQNQEAEAYSTTGCEEQ